MFNPFAMGNDRLTGIFSDVSIPQGSGIDSARDAKLAMAAQLMQATPYKSSFGEVFSKALMAGNAAKQQARQQSRQEMQQDQEQQLRQAQIQRMQQEQVPQDPAELRLLQALQQNPDLMKLYQQVHGGQDIPSDIQSARLYEQMTPEQRSMYDQLNRREQAPYFQWVQRVLPDGSTQQGTFNARTGETKWDEQVVPPGQKARVEAAGEMTGKGQAEASMDLSRVVDNARQSVQAIDSLLAAPGAPRIFGAQGMLPVVPGTSRADAKAMLEQVQGQTFLQAYQSLKGGGQITEVEGAKAEAAIAKLSRAQSWEAAQSALKDLKEVINAGVRRSQQKAGAQPTSSDPLGIR